jgi:hypothetical protein
MRNDTKDGRSRRSPGSDPAGQSTDGNLENETRAEVGFAALGMYNDHVKCVLVYYHYHEGRALEGSGNAVVCRVEEERELGPR